MKVIAFTNYEETMYVKKMVCNGALGYLLMRTDPESLLEAIKKVFDGGGYLDKRLEKAMFTEMIIGQRQPRREVKLTKLETEVLTLIAGEHPNQQIAAKLLISLRTVECHSLNITQELNIKHPTGLVKEAYFILFYFFFGGGDEGRKSNKERRVPLCEVPFFFIVISASFYLFPSQTILHIKGQ